MEDFEWTKYTGCIYVGLQFYWGIINGSGNMVYDYNCVYTVTKLDNGEGFLRFEWDKGDASEEYTITDLMDYIDSGRIKIKEDDSK
jgi:hypothetical protein